jgi:hypothetical protein
MEVIFSPKHRLAYGLHGAMSQKIAGFVIGHDHSNAHCAYEYVIDNFCSKDNTCLNKGHADIVAYKGVFIYFLRSSATGCTNQELRQFFVL